MTYPRRLRSPGAFSILAVVLAGYGLMIWASSFDANSYPGPHINLVLWVSVLLAVHIREQFADPRARLMPGFRRAAPSGGGRCGVSSGRRLPGGSRLAGRPELDRACGVRRCARRHDLLANTVADQLVESIRSRRLAAPGQLGGHG